MKLMDTSLAVFEIGSIALGYQVLNVICRDEKLRPIEASPVAGDKFLLLVQGPVASLQHAASGASRLCEKISRDLLFDQEILSKVDERLLPSLYSLAQTEMKEALLVLETGSVSGLLSAAQLIFEYEGLEPIELKAGKGLQGRGLGFFTGPAQTAKVAAEAVRVRLRSSLRDNQVEVIEQAPAAFREFFNLSGQP